MIISLPGSDSCSTKNETMSHSWFVNFHKDFDSVFPLWFIRWWTQFGSTVEIFPAPLKDCFLNFSIRLKTDTHGAKLYKYIYIYIYNLF